jgi:hypothetical protein
MDKILLHEINLALQIIENNYARADVILGVEGWKLQVNIHPVKLEPSTRKEPNMLSQKRILICYYFI